MNTDYLLIDYTYVQTVKGLKMQVIKWCLHFCLKWLDGKISYYFILNSMFPPVPISLDKIILFKNYWKSAVSHNLS